jgi:3-deoxy-D-manno-octulosonic-acid transferase
MNKLDRSVDDCDYAIEYSSEGELEFVKPLILSLIESGNKLELIFCSDSVHAASIKLQDEFPQNIQLFCLPIISYLPFGKNNLYSRLTSKKIIFTRYDFFPELIQFGVNNRSYLVSGSLKKYLGNPSILKRIYLRWVYSSFERIIMATETEKKNLIETFSISEDRVKAYDFRIAQIKGRVANSEAVLKERGLSPFLDSLRESSSKSIIYGSFWSDEVDFLKNADLDELNLLTHVFVPHKLDDNSITDCCSVLKSIFKREPIVIDSMSTLEFNSEDIYIIKQKGILCELYSHFDYSYIAGGFRSSVHSLLEPYLSKSFVLCGPNIHKSTEYDIIMDENPEMISLLSDDNFIASIRSFDKIVDKGEVESNFSINKYKDWLIGNA